MDLILEKGLEHQQKAVDAVAGVLEGVKINPPSFSYQNPSFDYIDQIIANNINSLQRDIRDDYKNSDNPDSGRYLNIDVKMETGTGKTYVYTQTIYELHKRYGFNKFIVAVPSLSIKAGAKQFISDNYVKHHFADACGYNCKIQLGVLESYKPKKKGFLAMPFPVREFVTGSYQNANCIYVLLVNMQLLTNGTMLTRDDYDYFVEGYNRPFDALRATKPVVIIDEPHRFSRDQKAYKVISQELEPEMIIRFGATFPEICVGKGKKKKIIKDYNNLVYDLNACDAFNLNLIKGVSKEHFEPLGANQKTVRILSINSKTEVNFQLKKRKSSKNFNLKVGDSLSLMDPVFDGIIIDAIGKDAKGKDCIELSNGQIKYKGDEFNADIYSSSYQEQMLKLAIQRHFEIERRNFSGRKNKIKTLALFFIDDISSYRGDSEDDVPYLKIAFERLLKEEIKHLMSKLSKGEEQYKDYLQASLNNIQYCHAGYFSKDNTSSDDEIAKEVDDILRNKKGLLSFVNEDGSYNTRRFLFSKWTLKEGWDNPNVFTIAKMRSSGSDISRIQEVGRGLRLPVDENGNRISNEEFKLNYIVDFNEKDFAQDLVDEINVEIPESMTIDPSDIERVANERNADSKTILIDLLQKNYIDIRMNIISNNKNVFNVDYPEFAAGVNSGKIINRNQKEVNTVKIRKDVYYGLKKFWEAINKKYYLFYEKDLEDEIPSVLHSILRESDTFAQMVISSHRETVVVKSGKMDLCEDTGVSYIVNNHMLYSDFLKRISSQTCIPIVVIHSQMCELAKERLISEELINEHSAAQIVNKFRDWKIENTRTRFHYSKSNQKVSETALTYSNGDPKDEITQGFVGRTFIPGTPSEKYLYDTIAFDSPLEKDNIMTDISEVVVYGKIPKASISIPTIVDETYSPDFMYVVKDSDGTKRLNIIIETKFVENQSSLRGTEEAKIYCAELFFKQLALDGYPVSFRKQLSNKSVNQIVNELL